MNQRIIQFFTLLLLVLITGVFWGTWFTLTRSLEAFPAESFIQIGKTIIANVAIPMRIIMPAAIVLMSISLYLYPRKRSVGFYCSLFAFVLLVITLWITVGVEVPIDNQIKHWEVNALPANWEAIRHRWKIFHAFRTFTALACFIFFLFPVVFWNKDDKSLN